MKFEMIFKNESDNYLAGKIGSDFSSSDNEAIIYSLQREHIIE